MFSDGTFSICHDKLYMPFRDERPCGCPVICIILWVKAASYQISVLNLWETTLARQALEFLARRNRVNPGTNRVWQSIPTAMDRCSNEIDRIRPPQQLSATLFGKRECPNRLSHLIFSQFILDTRSGSTSTCHSRPPRRSISCLIFNAGLLEYCIRIILWKKILNWNKYNIIASNSHF